jgi:hypothetical protein
MSGIKRHQFGTEEEWCEIMREHDEIERRLLDEGFDPGHQNPGHVFDEPDSQQDK